MLERGHIPMERQGPVASQPSFGRLAQTQRGCDSVQFRALLLVRVAAKRSTAPSGKFCSTPFLYPYITSVSLSTPGLTKGFEFPPHLTAITNPSPGNALTLFRILC